MEKIIRATLLFTAFITCICSGVYSQTSCGVDTVNYTYYKTTQFRPVSLNSVNSGNAFAQWYPAPQPITVAGFDFYAWQSAGTNAVVTLTCNIYRASASDSLPTGAPLRSITINVDSTFGNGQLSALKKTVTFSTPITITVPYVLTVENTGTTNVSVLANDYAATTPNGRKEWLSSVRIGANYLRSYNINVGGIAFDADFILQPHVSYSLKADFTISECNRGGNAIDFVNTSSNVIASPFYNRYAYFNIPQFCYMWNYGDTSGIYYTINGNHTYNNRIAYDVTLKDTLYGWTKGCSHSTTKKLNAVPDAPKVYNDGPVCSGNPLRMWIDTVPGQTYFWAGPNGYLATKPDTVFSNADTIINGMYMVSAGIGGCVSSASNTIVKVYKTPETPVADAISSKCVGDSVDFNATSSSQRITYVWTGENGFSTNSKSFRFTNLDTTYRGNYTVYVEDAFCKSGYDTALLYIYPPPTPPKVSSAAGNVLCEGDSLYLIGNSVAGAVFAWQGPDGFTSSTTNPILPSITTAKAGVYKAFVIIGSCTSTDDSVSIVINTKPAAAAVANKTDFCDGDSATLTANTGVGLTYQWYKDSVEINTAQAAELVVKNTGVYRVLVTNTDNCKETSIPVSILNKPFPAITTQPTAVGVHSGKNAVFSVVSPNAGVTYQWEGDAGTTTFAALSNTVPYSGVQTNTLTITNTTSTLTGYQYRCMVELNGCSTTSSAVPLTIFVGVEEFANGGKVSVYPNPTNGILTVDLELLQATEISFTIMDIAGREYMQLRPVMAGNSHVLPVDVSQLAKGMYLLKVKAGKDEKLLRFAVN